MNRYRSADARWPAGRYDFLASRLRVGVSVTLPHVQLVLQGQDTRLTNLPGDADALGPGALYVSHTHDTSQGEPFVKLGFVTLRRSGFAFTGGRFEYADGLVQPFSDPRDVTPRRPTCPAVGPVGIRPFIRRRFGNRFHPRWKEGSFDVQKGIARIVDRYRRAIAAEQ